MLPLLLLLSLGLLSLLFSGCPKNLEANARDAAAAAQGFIQQAQQNHLTECKADPSKDFPCGVINRAVGAQNLLVSAVELYCGWPAFASPDALQQFKGQPCIKSANYAQRVSVAINSLNAILGEYKLASGGKP